MAMVTNVLTYIGAVSIIGGLGWVFWFLIKQVKWRNPIKSYIRRIVFDYLQELSKDA